MSTVAENLVAVRDRIDSACRAADRDPTEVRLLPVTKTYGPDVVRLAYQAGARLVGENRVQELADKSAALADLPDLRWAMIGHLQTNKAATIAETATEFHALDSLRLAEDLNRRLRARDRSLDVFIQVNSSGEPQKFGLAPGEVGPFAERLAGCPALRVRGLMTLAVFSTDEAEVRACFRRMQQLQAQLRQSGAPGRWDELSMGMSGDFELAIEYGATTVRIGQAIFGARHQGI